MKKANKRLRNEDFDLPLDQQAAGQRRFVIRWSIYVVILYVIVTLLTAKSFSSVRVAAPLYEDESVDVAKTELYKGETTIYGWPIQWLLLHRESETAGQSGPTRLVRLKLSYVALLMNLAAVVCFLFATMFLLRSIREKKLYFSSAVTVLIAVAVIVMVVYFSNRNFLE